MVATAEVALDKSGPSLPAVRSGEGRRLRVLVLSWNFPTVAAPQRGLWVQRMCEASTLFADVDVVVPTPWVPPGLPIAALARFRSIPRSETNGRLQIHYPRVPGSVDYYTHGADADLATPLLLPLCRRLHAQRPFDLIHAHFIYPDGVVAARLGRALGIPCMTSEHSFWRPWLDDQARAGRQVRAALSGVKLIAPVSGFLAEDIERYARERNMAVPRMQVLPNVVDEMVFKPAMAQREEDQLLYVGLIRGFKRVDVLLQAFALARQQRPALRLKVLSAKSYAYARDRRQMMELIDSLSLREAVDIVVGAVPTEVADAMRRASFVVISSARRETFCSVAAEALACGTPLITTRCGGPEDFVGSDDGVMVEPDNPQVLCEGILMAFDRRGEFDSTAISRRIIQRFGREAWARQAQLAYESIVASAPARGATG